VPPSDCSVHGRILTYNPVGDGRLSSALAADLSPCSDYYIHLPALAADKTMPRGPDAVNGIHALGQQFHAIAEFNWGGWANDTTSSSWTDKATAFRALMGSMGYDLTRDAWAINEVPSTWKTDAAVKQNLLDVIAVLSAPAAGSTDNVLGAVFIIGIGSDTVNYSEYKPPLETWLADGAFWSTVRLHVRWWAQEVYPSPMQMCVGSANVGARSMHINAYAMHPAILAAAGPASVANARLFFDDAYTPALSAFWDGTTYDTKTLTLLQMQNFVSTEIYAARAWATSNSYPDGRIALAWNDQLGDETEADVDALAARIASSLHYAYDEGTPSAAKACSPSGAYTYCDCDVAGAAFNESWSAFGTW
jgi:hypothetical protein